MTFPNVTCNGCGWVSFGVSRQYALDEVKRFNEYLASLDPATRTANYGKQEVSITSYEKCWCGEPYTNARDSKPGDCPDGCTIGPMIHWSEK
jgi:hypothetical protein